MSRCSGHCRAHLRAGGAQDVHVPRAPGVASARGPPRALVCRPALRGRRAAGAVNVDSAEPPADAGPGRTLEARQRCLTWRTDAVEPGHCSDARGDDSADLSRSLSPGWLVRAAAVDVTRL